MTMAMTAYKTRGLDSRTQAIAVINGFQGQLKHWWDNFLSEDEHNKLLDYKKVQSMTMWQRKCGAFLQNQQKEIHTPQYAFV